MLSLRNPSPLPRNWWIYVRTINETYHLATPLEEGSKRKYHTRNSLEKLMPSLAKPNKVHTRRLKNKSD